MHRDEQDPLPTRSSLIKRLRNWEDQHSWRDFFDTYWKLIYAVAIKAGLSDADARDVVQETIVAAAKGLQAGRFQTGVGSFKAWLLLITRRRIADHLRRLQAEPLTRERASDESSRTPLSERIPDRAGEGITEIWEEEWNRNLADAALQRAREKVGAKQYQMFDLYVLKEWPVRDVARTMHVNIAQVYLAKHRITRLAKKELQRLETGVKGGLVEEGRKAPTCSPKEGRAPKSKDGKHATN
jgi:RNA polymerase sigma-70 factor (ECF subfamily)